MEKNKADLTACAERILLARESHFPATIADLYNPQMMPDDLRAAHEHNDEVLERIYIGRRFKNDTERLEKLFDMYSKTVAPEAAAGQKKRTDDRTQSNPTHLGVLRWEHPIRSIKRTRHAADAGPRLGEAWRAIPAD